MIIIQRHPEFYGNIADINQLSIPIIFLILIQIILLIRLKLMKNDRQNRQKWDKKGRNNGTFKYLSNFLRTIEML